MKRILVIDNIDSFVYNLVQYVGEEGVEPVVLDNRSGRRKVDKVAQGVDRIIISPGPKRPEEAGISNYVIKRYAGEVPILGVCLGHQCIGYVYGGKIRRARTLMHGKISAIRHNGRGIFSGLKNPLKVVRYHSLVIDEPSLPDCLEVTARSMDDGEIMGIEHKDYPVFGVQFHPESILTQDGKEIIRNFLRD